MFDPSHQLYILVVLILNKSTFNILNCDYDYAICKIFRFFILLQAFHVSIDSGLIKKNVFNETSEYISWMLQI
jgi:hypothetical protein